MKSNLKRLRKEAGLTLQQLADQSGVCKSQVYQLQKDGANPTLSSAAKIADALSISRTEIFIIWRL